MEGVGTELEVPDHPDATIRLHKARIKSLTSELQAAQTALKDKCVYPVAPRSLCLLNLHACLAILTLHVVALRQCVTNALHSEKMCHIKELPQLANC